MPLFRKRRLPKLSTQADYDGAVAWLVEALGGGSQSMIATMRIMAIAAGDKPSPEEQEVLAIVDEIGRDTKRAVPCLCAIAAHGPTGGPADMAQAILTRIGKRAVPHMREYLKGSAGGRTGWVTSVIDGIESR